MLTFLDSSHFQSYCLFDLGLEGVYVSIEDTIKGFNMILNGELDHLPEAAFNLVGSIEDAIEKGNKLLAEAKA